MATATVPMLPSPPVSPKRIAIPPVSLTMTTSVTTPSSVASSSSSGSCEPALRLAVRETLWPVVVCHKGSKNFGLEQRSLREGDSHEVGGWLRKVKKANKDGRQFGEAQYYILDDAKEMLCQIKQNEVKDAFLYRKIVSVTAHMEGSGNKKSFFLRVVAITGGEQKAWELSPADTSDRQLLINWTAALQIRSKTYDVVLDLDHEKVLKVALWCQSLYRGFRGRVRADKLRARRARVKNKSTLGGIQRMVSGLLFTGTTGTAAQSGAVTTSTTPGNATSTSGSSGVVRKRAQRKLEDLSSSEDDDDDEDDDDETELDCRSGGREDSHNGQDDMGDARSSPTKSVSSIASAPAGTMTMRGLFTSFRRNVFRERGLTTDETTTPPPGDFSMVPPNNTSSTSSSESAPEMNGTTTAQSSAGDGKLPKHVRFPSDRSLVVSRTLSRSNSGGLLASPTTTSGKKLCHKPATNMVEDEIWENQRWSAMAMRGTQVFRGWSDVALLPTERGPFSDRLGKLSWFAKEDVPVPKHWRVTKDWTLDLSSDKCNSEGWHYAQTFASVDSNLASGRSNFSASARWLVRTRRWYRIREKDQDASSSVLENGAEHHYHQQQQGDLLRSSNTDDDDCLYISGWVGMRGITTGRWVNSYTFLPKRRVKEHLGVMLCYFKKSARVFNEDLTFRYDFNNPLHSSRIKVKYLDNLCVVSDTCATRDQPGLFALHLSGEAEPRVFNAHSAVARIKWVGALREAIAASPGPCYEAIANRRSMRKGAAWELLRASEAVKDLVGGGVRNVKAGLATMKRPLDPASSVFIGGNSGMMLSGNNNAMRRQSDLHRVESDPDMPQVESLREEYRRNDAAWNSSATAPTTPVTPAAAVRKFSTDSLGSVELPPAVTVPPPPQHRRSTSKESANGGAGANHQQQIDEAVGHDLAPSGDSSSSHQPPDSTSSALTMKTMTKLKMLPKKLLKPGNRKESSQQQQQQQQQHVGGGESSGGEMSPPTSALFSSVSSCISSTALPSTALPSSSTLLPNEINPNDFPAEFVMPAPYENIMFDGHFDVSCDDFDTIMFREEEFSRDILAQEKMFEVELEPWTNGLQVGSEHRRRYKMPRVGVVPPGPAFHLLTRTLTVPGKGYVVDQVCSTPDVPFGQHFSTDLRNVIVADGPRRCRVIISQRVTLFKSLMAQSFIRSGTKREMTGYYKNVWPQYVRKWLMEKRKHLLSFEVTSSSTTTTTAPVPTTGAIESSSSSSSASIVAAENSDMSHNVFIQKLQLMVVVIAMLMVAVLLVFTWTMAKRTERLEALLVEINIKMNTNTIIRDGL